MNGTLIEEEKRLRAAIRRDTAGLHQAVDELQSVAKKRVSARHAISQHPLPWLGGALVLGWIIGSRLK